MNAKTSQKIAFGVLLATTLAVVAPVLIIIMVIIKEGITAINWRFLTTMPSNGMRSGGIFPAIVGTIDLVLLSVVIALPVGVMAAIYLNEYAKDKLLTRIIKLSIVNLAGVPSVVYGLFGLGLFVIFLKFGVCLLSGALTLAIMELPVIITTSKEALSTVPLSFREVSLSLGVSKWQTIRYVVLPHALPGIMTGTILSIARIAGETAPILFTAAAFYIPRLPGSLFDQIMVLPYHLFIISTQIPNMPSTLTYGTALVLLILVVMMNFTAIVVRTYFRMNKKW